MADVLVSVLDGQWRRPVLVSRDVAGDIVLLEEELVDRGLL